jgi:hypothetical protein
MGWEGKSTICDMPLQNVKKQVELFFILMERMLIKIFSRIMDTKKLLLLNHLVERKDLT